MYYRSGTDGTLLHRRQPTLRVHSPGGSTYPREMMLWSPSWKCDVKSMHIYLKNNAAKFHRDPMRNNGALGFLKRSPQ